MGSPPGTSSLLSADGRWRWDGVRWVPVVGAPEPSRPMRGRWVALIVVGSIASLLLAGTGLAALSSVYGRFGARAFTPGASSNCLPSDFPSYPNATIVTSLKAFNICTTAYATADSSADVLAYYQAQLGQYPWRVTGGSGDQGTVDFARQDGAKGSGEVSVSPSRNATQIQVVYQT